MDTALAKGIYSEVWRIANAEARANGGRIGEGAIKRAARSLWESRYHNGDTFETWWKDLFFSANGNTGVVRYMPNESELIQKALSKRSESIPVSVKYRALIEKMDILPSDDVMSAIFNCAKNTLSGIRSDYAKRGWKFGVSRQSVTVVRPEPEVAEQIQSEPVTVINVEAHEVLPATVTLTDLLIEQRKTNELLEKLIRLWE